MKDNNKRLKDFKILLIDLGINLLKLAWQCQN